MTFLLFIFNKYRFLFKVLLPALLLVLVTVVVTNHFNKKGREREVISLQNQIARQSDTIQVKDGLYKKLSEQSSNILEDLKTKDKQLAVLSEDLKKEKVKILTVNKTSIGLKKPISVDLPATQETVEENNTVRYKVVFDAEMGIFEVVGYTLTNPADVKLVLAQRYPLNITTTTVQAKDGTWQTLVQTSDTDFELSVDYSVVNPYILQRSWYENISLDFSLGLSGGVVPCLGASYDFGKYSVGASVGFDISGEFLSRSYYITTSWRPFSRH